MILALVKYYLSIYEKIQVLDKIRDKAKLLQLTKISTPLYLNTIIYQVPITNNHTNTLISPIFSSITGIIMPIA